MEFDITKAYNNVVEFMTAAEQEPLLLNDEQLKAQIDLYDNLIIEEFYKELVPALKKYDLVEIADGIADTIWVVIGKLYSKSRPVENIVQSLQVQQNIFYAQELYDVLYNQEIADDIDILYTVITLAKILHLPLQEIWDEVYASNMSKVVNGTIQKDENGKVMKPATYFKPDLTKIIFKK